MFRKYSAGSRDGKIVLVEHTNIQDPDFGLDIQRNIEAKNMENDTWIHESIILKPLSDNMKYQDIILSEDELRI
jgi:hypothetical protein